LFYTKLTTMHGHLNIKCAYLSLVLNRNTEFRIHIPFLGIFLDWPYYKYGFQKKIISEVQWNLKCYVENRLL